jgi:hypothetical protein
MTKTFLDHFLVNTFKCLLHYNLRTCAHTHTQDYTNLRNIQNHNEWIDLYQNTMYIDCLITIISYMHTQHCVCTCYWWTLYPECHISHITNIGTLAAMDACMLYETTLVIQSLITDITNIRAHHYVCVYAFRDYTCNKTPYYTHYKHNGTYHYAYVDVLSYRYVD